ncbi:MAG: hypothetical protein ACREIP_00475 [Alphaproteobacteria bacterium]
MATRIRAHLDEARQETENLPTGGHPIIRQVQAAIETRAKRVMTNLEEMGEVEDVDAVAPKRARAARPAQKRRTGR